MSGPERVGHHQECRDQRRPLQRDASAIQRGPELFPVFPPHRVSVTAMNTLAALAVTVALAGPLQSLLRMRLHSTTLFREMFFWRLKRDLQKR